MRISQYLIVKKSSGWRYTSRLTAKVPALSPNEVAIKIAVEIPDAIFTRPALEAEIKVPESAVSKPIITAEVIDNVQDIIKQNLGFDVKLELIKEEE